MSRAAILPVVAIVGVMAGAALSTACESICMDTSLEPGRYALAPESAHEFHADNYVLILTDDRRVVTEAFDLDGKHYELTYAVTSIRR